MADDNGHFENGRWIPDSEASSDPEIEDMVAKTHESVKKAMDDVVALGKNLLGTDEGREHIEKKGKEAKETIEDAINDIASEIKRRVE